jgi:hypothetical protein
MVINRRTFSAALIAGAAASLASTRGMDFVRALISADDRCSPAVGQSGNGSDKGHSINGM